MVVYEKKTLWKSLNVQLNTLLNDEKQTNKQKNQEPDIITTPGPAYRLQWGVIIVSMDRVTCTIYTKDLLISYFIFTLWLDQHFIFWFIKDSSPLSHVHFWGLCNLRIELLLRQIFFWCHSPSLYYFSHLCDPFETSQNSSFYCIK